MGGVPSIVKARGITKDGGMGPPAAGGCLWIDFLPPMPPVDWCFAACGLTFCRLCRLRTDPQNPSFKTLFVKFIKYKFFLKNLKIKIKINRLWINFAAYGLIFCRLCRLWIDFLPPMPPTEEPPSPPHLNDCTSEQQLPLKVAVIAAVSNTWF